MQADAMRRTRESPAVSRALLVPKQSLGTRATALGGRRTQNGDAAEVSHAT